MPKGDYSRISGRQSKLLIDLANRYGFPYRPEEKTVDVGRLLRWFHDFIAANAGLVGGSTGDDQILNLASKELKDEYVKTRITEKNIDIERKRIELNQLNENYLPIEPMRQYHNSLASLLAAARIKGAKRFEGENREFFERLFEDMIGDHQSLAESLFNDADDPATEQLEDPHATK